MATTLPGLEKLIQVVAAIRDPESGCPWDLEQTHSSLIKYFFEEVHEFSDALSLLGPRDPRSWEELGDCLLQVALHARMFEENGDTSLDEVAKRLSEKLILRHPHVFDPTFERFKNADEVNANWEKIKAWEKAQRAKNSDAISSGKEGSKGLMITAPGAQNTPPKSTSPYNLDVPFGLPAFYRAMRLGEKAASYGFDWKKASDVLEKLKEEISELEEAATHEMESEAEELADLLFACTQYARKKKWDPEQLLHKANEKFRLRFERLAQLLISQNLRMEDLSLETLESMWQESKSSKP